ncbi:hypothetical protein QF024_001201 [Chryseobacterium nepalense]|nr:hypothetical protein [Chryseobacterium nepalense]
MMKIIDISGQPAAPCRKLSGITRKLVAPML